MPTAWHLLSAVGVATTGALVADLEGAASEAGLGSGLCTPPGTCCRRWAWPRPVRWWPIARRGLGSRVEVRVAMGCAAIVRPPCIVIACRLLHSARLSPCD